MSSKDKTRDKLVASLRKTRVTVNEEADKSKPAASSAPSENTPATAAGMRWSSTTARSPVPTVGTVSIARI